MKYPKKRYVVIIIQSILIGVIRPNKVRSSIRYEANRDAAQDFELLHILGTKDPETAKELVDSVGKNADSNFSTDIYHMRRQRDKLVREAARVADEE